MLLKLTRYSNLTLSLGLGTMTQTYLKRCKITFLFVNTLQHVTDRQSLIGSSFYFHKIEFEFVFNLVKIVFNLVKIVLFFNFYLINFPLPLCKAM